MKVNLSGPDIGSEEIVLVNRVLNSGILSIGPVVEEFEDRFKDYFGVKHAIAVNSGTSGLHLLVKALGIGEDDEVITSPFSFVASVNCFLFERAVPVFVDIDEKTLNMDINGIEEKITEKTRAIVAVDIFGQPMDMERIRAIAEKHNLKVIEDSCEAIGSEYNGIKAGTLADGAVFAFYPNKQMTTGEGGMIITDDDRTAELCRSMRSQGRAVTGLWLYHERPGYNYRMSEVNAAIGLAQIKRLDEIIRRRQEIAELYHQKLSGIEGITLPYIDRNVSRMSWFVYVIRLADYINRDQVMTFLIERGVGCKPYF
ncbi:MAG: DegT/DnrJ/EryC1/StrS family aminotransferase, partial [Halanaerobiaceae bacterium]|nr:DegT/DnrJ/EryC1/StrS family aminotransferase [Halanaerobiaceae bacterium]